MCFFNFKPQAVFFRNWFENECFPKQWREVKVVPVHKKKYKEFIKNYRAVS